MTDSTAIAIVGMSCRYPGARDVEEYWANLRAGADTITRFSPARLAAAGVADRLLRHPDFVPARGELAGGEYFDREFFGYSPADAASIDPQQAVLLETASSALDDAGIDPRRFAGLIGVFAGCDAVDAVVDAPPPAREVAELARLIGQDKDFLATRVAYKLGLRGPALTVQTACSTSLVAAHTASQSLLGYECDAALAGGVSLTLPQAGGYVYREGLILSRDGRCRPFDADATGTVPSNGVGVVVLRRLVDALRDGDRVIAVIRGSAVNNDGGEKIGYTAPSIAGQRDVIRFALAQAGAEAGDVGYVEAHGTGTRVGDPVEVGALAAAFRETTEEVGFCRLGAAKSNIGHTSSASGVAGLIKTALMLERRTLVPTVHFGRPNPELELSTTPFRISTSLGPLDVDARPLAGVSSFGIGGTNAHAVLEPPPTRRRASDSGRSRLLCLSAATPAALGTLRTELADRLETAAPRLDDAAWTLAEGRRSFAHRLTVVADRPDAAAGMLRDNREPVIASDPKVAFLFPGQGSLRPGAGGAAHELLPAFRRTFDELLAEADTRFGVDLGRLLDPAGDPAWSRDPVHQQLGLFALGYALAGQLREWGVRPAVMLGNSVGEYVAAVLAGVWAVPDALTVLWRRGTAMREAPAGRMLAVTLPHDDIAALVAADPELALAIDAPGYGVVAGGTEAVDALRERLTERGTACRLVDTERAFHSPAMGPVADAVREALADVPADAPTLEFVSTLTGTVADPERVRSPEYWADQAAGTVRLASGAERLLASACDVFVELGPGRTMTRAVRRHPDWDGERLAVTTLDAAPLAERDALLSALGRLWERGVPVGVADLLDDAEPVRCALPAHPFARTATARMANARPHTPAADRRTEPAGGLSHQCWAETVGARGRYDSVAVLGSRDPATWRFVETLARLGASVRVCARDRVLDLGAGEALVVDAAAGLAERLDELADQLRDAPVVVLGRGLAGLDAPPADHHTDLLAWARHRSRLAPGSVRVLDLGDDVGTGEPPPHPPAMSGEDWLYAWRGRRWWVLAAKQVAAQVAVPVPDTAGGGSGPVAVLDLGTGDGAGAAADLAAHGVPVAAFVVADRPTAWTPPSELAAAVTWPSIGTSLSGSPELGRRLDTYCAGLVGTFVRTRAGLRAGERVGGDALREHVSPRRTLPRMVDLFVRVLTERGWLRPVEAGEFEVAPDFDASLAGALGEQAALGAVDGLVRLLRRCVDAYPEVFAGTRDPMSVLFPDGQEDLLREHVSDNELALGDDDACLDVLCQAVRAMRARRAGPLRVLEVGGGGGALTWRLLDGWRDDPGVTYYFTDVSPLRVRQARERAAVTGVENLRCSTFDITSDPVGQGLAPGTFDLVLAYNVVHLAPSVLAGLENLRRMLAPGGMLGMVELATVPLWMNLIWGLASGWWDFTDDLRDGSAHVAPDTWRPTLAAAGLTEFARLPEERRSDHLVVLATGAPAATAGPDERVAAELRRQAPGTELAAVLALAGQDAASTWEKMCVTGVPAWLVSEDPGPGTDWHAERDRRRLDPPWDGPEPRWRHVEVARLGAAELAALPDLVHREDAPPIVRLAPAPLPAPGEPAKDPRDEPGAETSERPVFTTGGAADPVEARLAAIWCDVLGLPAAAPGDDFFDLGGDSLSAVHLTARVREHLGQPVSLAAFTGSATFGDLLELVRANGSPAGSGTADEDLLVLREGGARAPLFLAAPATGSSLCYRRLARLLDDDQPCYGIESPGLRDGGRAPSDLEDVAAHHVEMLRRVRPHGPYLVGGWSVGAMVAHEMARQLTAHGERVPLVVCVDTAVTDTNGWPLAVAPGIAVRGLWYQLQVRLPRWARGARQQIAELVDLPGAPDFGGVFDANIRAMLRYQPRPVPARAVLFSTGLGTRSAERLRRRIGPMYRHGVEVRPAPGDHWTVLGERHVGRLAEDLRRVLAAEWHPPAANPVTVERNR